jgi:signal transduction histidine kinase
MFTVLSALTDNTPYRGLTLLIARHAEWFALAFLPLTLAFSIFRYRLWDIDPLLNRTLVYGGLTLLVLALYGAIVFGLGAAFGSSGNIWLAVAATGVIAIAFNPLRQRLQRAVNRLMYGDRDDPATVLARLGQRLETALAPEATLSTIVETVAQTLKVPYVAIELTTADPSTRPTTVEHPSREAVHRPPSVVTFPLTFQSELLGQLLVAPRAPGEAFSPADRRLLEQIAQQAAPAVHAYRLTADLHRSRERIIVAREEERRRLRRDLHDELGPTLASQTFKLDAALDWLDRDPASARKLLGEVKAQTQATVADIRRLVYELRPPALDELGLVGALRAHVQSLSAANGLHVTVDAPRDLPPLSAAVEVAAYRIALEALTNVVRHAQAHACQVHLAVVEESLQLDIADDGLGLPHESQAGMGLTSMRERADELGGTCVIENRPGGGMRVYAELPITPSAHG